MTSSESPHSFDETEGPFHPAHRHCRRRAGGGGRRQGGQGRHQECQGPGGESEAHADRPWARGSPQRRPCSSTPATCTRHPPASWVGYTAGPPAFFLTPIVTFGEPAAPKDVRTARVARRTTEVAWGRIAPSNQVARAATAASATTRRPSSPYRRRPSPGRPDRR